MTEAEEGGAAQGMDDVDPAREALDVTSLVLQTFFNLFALGVQNMLEFTFLHKKCPRLDLCFERPGWKGREEKTSASTGATIPCFIWCQFDPFWLSWGGSGEYPSANEEWSQRDVGAEQATNPQIDVSTT